MAAVPADNPPPDPLPMVHGNATSNQALQFCRGAQLSNAVPPVTEGLLHYFLAPQVVRLYLQGLDFGQKFPVLNFIVRYSHKPILIILAGKTQGRSWFKGQCWYLCQGLLLGPRQLQPAARLLSLILEHRYSSACESLPCPLSQSLEDK